MRVSPELPGAPRSNAPVARHVRSTTHRTVTTIATGFQELRGITVSPAGDLYAADSGFNMVVKISPTPQTDDCF